LLSCQLINRDFAQSDQASGLSRRPGQQFPSANALQSTTRLPLLASGAEQAVLGVTEVTLEVVAGAWQFFDIVAMEQARPIAGADLIQVAAKSTQTW